MGGGKKKKRDMAAKAPKAKPAKEPAKPKQKRNYVKHATVSYKQAGQEGGNPVKCSYK